MWHSTARTTSCLTQIGALAAQEEHRTQSSSHNPICKPLVVGVLWLTPLLWVTVYSTNHPDLTFSRHLLRPTSYSARTHPLVSNAIPHGTPGNFHPSNRLPGPMPPPAVHRQKLSAPIWRKFSIQFPRWLWGPLGLATLALIRVTWRRYYSSPTLQSLSPSSLLEASPPSWAVALVTGAPQNCPQTPRPRNRSRSLLAARQSDHSAQPTSSDLDVGPVELDDGSGAPPLSRMNSDADEVLGKLRNELTPFWEQHLLSCWPLRPVAAELLRKLEPSNALLHPKVPKGKDTLFDYVLSQKLKHKDKVLLVKVGEFYETWGLDAVLLVQHCGLNPMGGGTRAGCPLSNIQQTIDSLVDAGLMVAVYEEGREAPGKKTLKNRFLGGILSPVSSTYIYNARLRMDDIQYREGWAYIGVQISAGGASVASVPANSLQYTVYEVYVDAKCVHVSEKLTKEAAQCLIQRSRQSTDSSTLFWAWTGGGDLPAPVKRFLGISESQGRSVHLGNADLQPKVFLPEMLKYLADELERTDLLDKGAMSKVMRDCTHQPRSLYVPTAQQLGLIPSAQVPDLATHLLSPGAPARIRRFFRNWLLQPPPYAVADAMQSLLKALHKQTAALPPLDQPLSPSKFGALLGTNQANASMFRELYHVLETATRILDPKNPFRKGDPCVTGPLLDIVVYESAIEEAKDADGFLETCIRAMHMIKEVVPLDLEAARTQLDLPGNCSYKKALEEMIQANEEQFTTAVLRMAVSVKVSTAKVKSAKTKHYYSKLDDARKAFIDALEKSYGASNEKDIKYSSLNNHITISTSKAPSRPDIKWVNAKDRNHKPLKTWTTPEVKEQGDAYLSACQEAATLAQQELEALSRAMSQPNVFPAAKASIYLKDILHAAYLHLQESIRRGWALPTLESLQDMNRHNEELVSIQLDQLWPYWLRKEEAVKNDVHLKGQWLLTGPNMSGKSTLLRSLTGAALLANSGLAAPVSAEALVPRLDGYFLRTNTTDCPTEGKSSFALELEDMCILLRDATRRSLAAVDEFGRGTAPAEGAALGGHLLEHLDRQKCPSIFATHLHFELLQLNIMLPHTYPKRLRVDLEGPGSFSKSGEPVRWTYALEDGICSDSLAVATARRQGVPDAAVLRTVELLGMALKRSGIMRAKLAVPVEYPHLQCEDDGDDDNAVGCNSWSPVQCAASDQEDPAHLHTKNHPNGKSVRKGGKHIITSDPLRELHRSKFDMAVTIVKGTCGADIEEGPECRLLPGDMPPANMTNRACLYLLLLPSGDLYVGETDSVSQRILTHRKSKSSNLEAAIFVVNGGKSIARRLEAQAIRALQSSGLSPVNSHDSAHRNFAVS